MLTIDFVSDVACPWCAVGLNSLELALQRVAPEVQAVLRFQPFELNPQCPPEGEDAVAHLQRKYGISSEQVKANGERLRERGAEVGFTFTPGARQRVWNTRAAHRLLHWAGLSDAQAQRRLKHALLKAYFTDGLNPGDAQVLARLAGECGLDAEAAARVLADGDYEAEVAQAEAQWHASGVSSVPTLVINERYVITGGQPPETFEKALRHIAAEAAGQDAGAPA